MVIKPEFDEAEFFYEGFAVVKKRNQIRLYQ
ncbi:MAG: WG repeat-containing protein [Chitinophagaceae bacterium]|nr:WG repeat-containing protein [Chitinophagaceae bacterium]